MLRFAIQPEEFMSEPIRGPFHGRPLAGAIAIAALLLAAINLRGGLVVVGPLVTDITRDLALSASQFSMLTTVPLICFGVVSAFVPLLTRRFGPAMLVLGALALISLGAWLRITPEFFWIMSGTLMLGSAIALLNVLIPGLVKGYFPEHPGVMTGLYSVTLAGGAAMAVYIAIPVRDLYQDWRAPMTLWAMLPLVCTLPWLYLLRVHIRTYQPPQTPKIKLWHNRRAWAITGYMGLQSTYFYCIATWLPNLLIDNGMNEADAGFTASLLNIVGISANLLVPMIATRLKDQRPVVIFVAVVSILGLGGLLITPMTATYFWAAMLGLGAGSSLSLALTLFALRSDSTTQAVALSAMAQSIGYLIAALGPLVVGALHDLRGGWEEALILLLILQIAQFFMGLGAGRAGTLSDG